MGRNNIIELNGKQYDALTGALLGESKIAATPGTKSAHLKRQGRNMDGFIRSHRPANDLKPVVVKPETHGGHEEPTARHPAAITAAKPPLSSLALPKQAKSMGDIRKGARHASKPVAMAHHQPEKPKTLMRHVVKKPEFKMKPAIKTTIPAEMMARPTSTLAKPLEKKLSVSQVNPVRLGRAQRVPRSHHIRRFGQTREQQLAEHVAAGGQTHPAQAQARPQAQAAPLTTPSTIRQDFRAPAARVPAAVHAQAGAAQAQPSSPRANQPTDIFEAALAHATSHEQKSPVTLQRSRARRRRFVNIAAGLGAFLVIAGFLAYLNKPAIELRVASINAGFHAQMPGYKPTGYALEGGIKSSDGKVAMQFRSGEKTYRITQEVSDWNSSTLLDQTAERRGAPTRTIQSKGRTIYIYDDKAATWVNGGVRYEITGNSSFDAGELVSMATSM